MTFGISTGDVNECLASADMNCLLDMVYENKKGDHLTEDEADALDIFYIMMRAKSIVEFKGDELDHFKSALSKLKGSEEDMAYARYILYLIGDSNEVSFDS